VPGWVRGPSARWPLTSSTKSPSRGAWQIKAGLASPRGHQRVLSFPVASTLSWVTHDALIRRLHPDLFPGGRRSGGTIVIKMATVLSAAWLPGVCWPV